MLGFEYSLLAVGIYISFRILDMADLTVDGSFCLGMAVSATCAVAGHPVLGLVLGCVAGAAAGCVTGLLITRAKINPLLAGIISMTGLYSVNIYVLGGPNVSLLDAPKAYDTFVTLAKGVLKVSQVKMVFIVVLVAAIVAVLAAFLHTESGLAMRATGDNEDMCRASSINTNLMKVVGLAVANCLVGLTGALLAQYQGYADMGSGTGMVMVGLASVIIGELFGGRRGVTAGLVCSVVGSVVYRLIIQSALMVNFIDSNALKLISACIVAVFMGAPAVRDAIRSSKQKKVAREKAEAYELALASAATAGSTTAAGSPAGAAPSDDATTEGGR
jgi:putative ABC transport system permease protein